MAAKPVNPMGQQPAGQTEPRLADGVPAQHGAIEHGERQDQEVRSESQSAKQTARGHRAARPHRLPTSPRCGKTSPLAASAGWKLRTDRARNNVSPASSSATKSALRFLSSSISVRIVGKGLQAAPLGAAVPCLAHPCPQESIRVVLARHVRHAATNDATFLLGAGAVYAAGTMCQSRARHRAAKSAASCRLSGNDATRGVPRCPCESWCRSRIVPNGSLALCRRTRSWIAAPRADFIPVAGANVAIVRAVWHIRAETHCR